MNTKMHSELSASSDHVREVLLNTFHNRFTCKRYEPGCSISEEDFNTIMEVARTSPSSFGMEPWKFLVIENPDLLSEILDVAWGAKQNAARTVIILARKGVTADSDYAKHIWCDIKGTTAADLAGMQKTFKNFQEQSRKLTTPERIDEWAAKQTYIPLANMLTAAAMLGIAATPIEGFDIEALNSLLEMHSLMDPKEFSASLIIQFGEVAQSHFEPHQTRRPANEIIQYVK